MLLERERTGGTRDTPPHTLLSSAGPDGGGGLQEIKWERKTEKRKNAGEKETYKISWCLCEADKNLESVAK